MTKKTITEARESAGQQRLPGVDVYFIVIRPFYMILKAALHTIRDGMKSITVRVGESVFTVKKSAGLVFDEVAEAIADLADADAADALAGMGFTELRVI